MKLFLKFITVLFTIILALSCTYNNSSVITSDDGNTTFEVRGKVTDLVDLEQKAVDISLSGNSLGTSDESGTFTISLEEGEHTLSFSKSGYTTAYSQVYVGSELPASSEATLLIPTGSTNPEGQETVNGTVSVVLKPTQNLSLSGSQSITLSKTGSSVTTQNGFNFQADRVFTRIKNKAGLPVKRQKYENASLDFSKIDPTRELDAMPGPLSAQDSTYQQSKARFKGRLNTSEDSVGLESVTMMDLTLRDADGNAIQMDEGDSLESFVRLPDRDQDNYREAYENGERVIPWYSFDPDQNTWVREGEAELVNINDEMFARADVTHFSWWNLDKPRDRGRLQGTVTDGSGNIIPGIEVVLEAIGTSFRTKTLTNSNGEYSFRILRNSKARVFVQKDGVASSPTTIDFDDSPETSPHILNLTFTLVNINGRVVSNSGQILPNALIKLPSGEGIYSDGSGQFSFEAGVGGAFELVTQYTQNDLNFITKTQITSDNLQSNFNTDIIIDLDNIIVVSGQVRLDGTGVPNATLYTLNGERTVADSNGAYSFSVSKTAGISSEDFEITLKAFYFDDTTSSFPELSFTIPINEGANELVQNFDFSSSSQVELIGRVTIDGTASQGVEIYCDNGCLTLTDSDGLYTIEGYVGQTLKIYAITTDLSNQPIRLEKDITLFETDSGVNQAETFEFVLPQATITGTVSIDMGNGQTIGLGAVRILSENGVQRQSASDGSYRFTLAPEVSNTLWFEVDTPSGLISIERSIAALDIDEVMTLDVSFARADILNLSPILENVEVSSFQVAVNDNVQITITAMDPDAEAGDLLSFSAISQNTALATLSTQGNVSVSGNSNTQSFSFNAGSQTGWVETQLSISDGENIITRSVYIEIVTAIINNPPSLLALQAPTKVQSDGRYDITYLVHDPEGDNLSFDFSITPDTGISLQTVTRLVPDISGIETSQVAENQKRLVLTGATVGTIYTLSANVSDGSQSLLTTQTFEVIDEAPIFKSFSPELDFLPYGDTAITFSAQAEDPEGQNLSYAWSVKVGDGSFENIANTSSFNFTPSVHLNSSDNIQTVSFIVSVSDGTNITEKQQNYFVLPANRGITKEPVGLSVVWNNNSQIDIGDSISFSATLTYNTGEQEDVTASVKTSGFNDTALSQNFNQFTALDDGGYLIQFTYTSNGFNFEDSLNLIVDPPFLTSLFATLSEATIVVGETVQVMLTALFDNGDQIDVTSDGNSQYFSSQEGVASFSSNTAGELSAHNVGSATLTFSYTDPNDQTVAQTTRDIQVQPIQLERFEVVPSHLDMVVGDSFTLAANAFYNNGASQVVTNYFSTSDNPDVAIVNEDNIVFPVGAGNTRFVHTYKENGIEQQSFTTINVTLPTPEIIKLRIVPEDAEIMLNKSQEIKVYAIYNTGTTEVIDNATVTMSSNLGVYSQGAFTANEMGMTTLTFRLGDLEATSELSLVPEPNEATFSQIAKIGGAAYKVDSLQRDIGGELVDLIVYSDYRNLSSVLVNNPDQPVVLDELSLPNGFIEDFELTENYLHLATGYLGYSMVTYDNPSSLEIPNGYEFKIDGWSTKVITQKVGQTRFAFLLSRKGWGFNGRTGIDGIVILDITNPRNIAQVGKIKLDGYPTDLAYADGKLYVSQQQSWSFNFNNFNWSRSGLNGITVIDVSNPNQASVLSSHSSTSTPYCVLIEGDNIVIGENSQLISCPLDSIYSTIISSINIQGYIYDINPDSKGYLVSLGWGGISRVTTSGNQFQLAYKASPPVPDWQPTFTSLDSNENDEQPSSVTRASVYSATQLNDILYLANGYNGLGIIEEENTGLGSAKNGFPNLGYTSEVQISDNLLFAASWEKGILALNIEDPINTTKMGEFQSPGYYISKIHWDEQSETLFAHLYSINSYWWWCYYGGSLGFNPHRVVALRWENNELVQIDSIATQGWVNAMDYSNGKLYMSANDFGVYNWGYDAAIQSIEWDGSQFGAIASQPFGDPNSFTYLRTLAAEGNVIVAGSYYGTYFYDDNLNLLSSLDGSKSSLYRYPSAYSFLYNGDLIIKSNARLHYVDISNPSTPKVLSSISSNWGYGLDTYGNVAMSSSFWGNIQLVSFKDPSNPVLIPTTDFNSPEFLEHLQWNGQYVFLGSGWNGIYVLDLQIPDQYTNFNPVAVLPEIIIASSNSTVDLDASSSYDEENDTLSYSWNVLSSQSNVSNLNSLLSNSDQVQTQLSYPAESGVTVVELTVADAYGSSNTQIEIRTNTAPLVNTGADQRFVSGSNVLLEGSYFDAEQNVSSFTWVQISGDNTTLSNAQTLTPLFTDPGSGSSYTYELQVTDGLATSSNQVTINRNTPPYITIEGLSTTGFGDNITLSSNVVQDADGDDLSFTWEISSSVQIEHSNLTSNVITLVTPAAVGNIQFSLTVFDGYENYQTSHILEVSGDNFPPIIEPLQDLLVERNQSILVPATASDQNQDSLSYYWEVTSGVNVIFSDNTNSTANITTPNESGNSQVRLNVSDNAVTSFEDFTVIINNRPQVTVSDNLDLLHTETIFLFADIFDTEQEQLDINWRQTSGSNLEWQDNGVYLTVTPPASSNLFEFEVEVRDSYYTVSKTVTANVTYNVAPVIDSISGNTVITNSSEVSLFASADDSDGDALSYLWEQTSGTNVTLNNASSNNLTFTPTTGGSYTFSVTVSDNNYTTVDYHTVIFNQNAPNISVSGNTNNIPDAYVDLDASASTDPDGENLNFLWQQISGNTVSISDNTSANISFMAGNTLQSYQFLLTATDSHYSSNTIVEVNLTSELLDLLYIESNIDDPYNNYLTTAYISGNIVEIYQSGDNIYYNPIDTETGLTSSIPNLLTTEANLFLLNIGHAFFDHTPTQLKISQVEGYPDLCVVETDFITWFKGLASSNLQPYLQFEMGDYTVIDNFLYHATSNTIQKRDLDVEFSFPTTILPEVENPESIQLAVSDNNTLEFLAITSSNIFHRNLFENNGLSPIKNVISKNQGDVIDAEFFSGNLWVFKTSNSNTFEKIIISDNGYYSETFETYHPNTNDPVSLSNPKIGISSNDDILMARIIYDTDESLALYSNIDYLYNQNGSLVNSDTHPFSQANIFVYEPLIPDFIDSIIHFAAPIATDEGIYSPITYDSHVFTDDLSNPSPQTHTSYNSYLVKYNNSGNTFDFSATSPKVIYPDLDNLFLQFETDEVANFFINIIPSDVKAYTDNSLNSGFGYIILEPLSDPLSFSTLTLPDGLDVEFTAPSTPGLYSYIIHGYSEGFEVERILEIEIVESP